MWFLKGPHRLALSKGDTLDPAAFQALVRAAVALNRAGKAQPARRAKA